MRTILNVVWLVLSGIWLFIGYVLAGVVMCVFIVTIPFGIASFRLAAYVLWPFGRTVVRRSDAGAASTIRNVIWFLLVGIWMAIAHLFLGLLLCLTIIGIPLGLGTSNWRLWPLPPSARKSCQRLIPELHSEPFPSEHSTDQSGRPRCLPPYAGTRSALLPRARI